MKRSILKWNSLIMGILVAVNFTACNNQTNENGTEDEEVADAVAEPVPTPGDMLDKEEGSRDFETFLKEYIDVKDALVQDEYQKARKEAEDVVNLVNAIEERPLIEKGQVSEQQLNELKKASRELSEAKDLKDLRQQFATLSSGLYELAQKDLLTEKTLYWQHCPMALENKGANWLSMEEEIQNPYMGQEMPKCGSVKETLQ